MLLWKHKAYLLQYMKCLWHLESNLFGLRAQKWKATLAASFSYFQCNLNNSFPFFFMMTTPCLNICLYLFRAVQGAITISQLVIFHCVLSGVEVSKLYRWSTECLKYFLYAILLIWVHVLSFIFNYKLRRKKGAKFMLFINMFVRTYAQGSRFCA